VHPPGETRRAIATSDIAALTLVPGIGRKGAERIVVELRDRVGGLEPDYAADQRPMGVNGVTAVAPWRDQLRHALAGLGFTGKEVADAIDVVAQEADVAHPDLPSALRRSIQLLGRAG
jgi:Holliday junction DNA helicase RuvA